MISKLWEWMRSWFALRRVSAAECAANRLASRLDKSLKLLSKRRRKLEMLEGKMKGLAESIAVDLEQAESLQQQYDETMEMLRSENRVMSECTIPFLVAEHRLALARVDSDIAVETKKRITTTIREE